MGSLPVQPPGSAVSVSRSATVPVIVGADALAGAVASAIGSVLSEVAVALTGPLLAVTRTRSVVPAEAEAGV